MPEQPKSGPLYARVRDILFERIKSGELKPGEELGSEFHLAAELGVSQGTVRKALEVLRTEKLLIRQQGRGTFVAEQTPASVLFRFFNVFDERGDQVQPGSQQVQVTTGLADIDQQARLEVAAGASVIQIRRVRTRVRDSIQPDQPFIVETITLPQALFPGLERIKPVPNTLYDLFQRHYGITVTHVDEQIRLSAASQLVADELHIKLGTPLLTIDRTTFSLGEKIVEWRVSQVHLAGCHYRFRVR
jgi:GntR family transcriptional regulator